MSNMTDLWLSGVFFQTLKYSKTRFLPGLHPGPRWGAYDAPQAPQIFSRLWRGYRLLSPSPWGLPFLPRRLRHLDLGKAPRLSGPRIQIHGYAYDRVGAHIASTRPI